ncbi:hypothetical protein LTR84_004986 [Exophiala bonariae]|uniref:Zn(2)-C6 fungal-type domain-containing protein n=1 Tax=Exophiala bonariae TaxID=1690606 RepID=A0AAV9NSH8_9EURO|nr:hypothetical protein LTR84_004986 [Exophiala bonariae]
MSTVSRPVTGDAVPSVRLPQVRPAAGSRPSGTRDYTPIFKRRRIGLACTSCRNRKSRCNGARPACSLCVELGFECFYEQPGTASTTHPAPPGPSDKYDDRLRSIEDTLKLLVQSVQLPQSQSAREGVVNAASVLFDEVDGTSATSEDDAIDGMGVFADPEDSDVRFFGPSSNVAFLRQISSATTRVLHALGVVPPPDVEKQQQSSLVTFTQASSPPNTTSTPFVGKDASKDILALPTEDRVLQLLHLFFSDTGMLFPFVHHEEIVSTYFNMKRVQFVGVRRSWLCLLNVIFAFSTSSSLRPNQPAEDDPTEPEVFFDRACRLTKGFDSRRPTLEMIQCFLLMSQYRQGTQYFDSVWDLHGMALKTAWHLGLHCKADSSAINASEAETRKRTFFGCLLLDRRLAMTFGRPPILPNQYFTMDMPISMTREAFIPTAGAASSALPDTLCLFTATIELHLLIGDVLADLYGNNLGSDLPRSLSEMTHSILCLEKRLGAWKRGLPPELQKRPWKGDRPDVQVSTPLPDDHIFDRLSVIMALSHLNVRILLHRSILSKLLSREYEAEEDSTDAFFRGVAEQSVIVCEASAIDLVAIVYSMGSDAAFLPAWWFTAYYTFNAALVLFACLVLRIMNSTSKTAWGEVSTHAGNPQRLSEMIVSLQHAIEISRKLGVGTMSSKRVRTALERLLHIALVLVQKHPAASSIQFANLPGHSLNSEMNGSAMFTSTGIPAEGFVSTANVVNATLFFSDPAAPMSVFPLDDQWIMGNDFQEIFGDLEATDTGPQSFMAV